ncbi:hypothetical protein ACFOG5_23900 [Pedobacter fastidiosus]
MKFRTANRTIMLANFRLNLERIFKMYGRSINSSVPTRFYYSAAAL